MTGWHLDQESLRRYSQGVASPVLAASAEAHLVKCAACRDVISSYVDARRVEAIWREVVDRVDAPRRTWPERMLARLGVGEATARLVAATPTLRGPWLLAVAGVLALAAWAAQADERFLQMFLVVAPLGPLAGVAVAFAGGLDPTREIGLAAPYSGLRLLLIRTAAVLAVTVPIVAAAGLALPGSKWLAAAWLLPTAGLICTALALTSRMTPVVAVGVVAGAWVLVTAPATVAGHLGVAFGIGAQFFWLAGAIGGGAWLAVTRNTITIRLGRSA
ncbi:zf-HC2 domain-containing protein [Actinomadura syzygii]|uniref:Zf-HC2 domain-containing protein n=1 Tax=Actinomadura syzygii TaxID=1427538 RepID=A0A5D0TV65_9ACTN|nr:zf-HC2 domain-containing protein [Actinomadura syzygii]TYC09757.1 zf-HC2 domain-containing protein [Actinomadura syzygii]